MSQEEVEYIGFTVLQNLTMLALPGIVRFLNTDNKRKILTLNQKVTGSIPVWPTILIPIYRDSCVRQITSFSSKIKTVSQTVSHAMSQRRKSMIKNRLRKIRHEMYIDSQVEMARLLGISREQYNRYEQQENQPSLETAFKIAQKLKKPLEDIFYQEPD